MDGRSRARRYVGRGLSLPRRERQWCGQVRVPNGGIRQYEVRINFTPHENRATNVPVSIHAADDTKTAPVNQRTPPPLPESFLSLGKHHFERNKPAVVTIGGGSADGYLHAAAVQLILSR